MAGDDLDPLADPPQADREQAALYWRALRKSIPGPWASDHWNQTTKGFVGPYYVAVDTLARAIGSATVNIVELPDRVDDEEAGGVVRKAFTAGFHESDERWVPAEPDHPARKVFEEPNPRQSIADVLYERTLQECLTGSSYTWVVPNGYGEPCEQYVLPTVLTLALPASEAYPNGAYRIQPATASGAYAVLPGRYAQSGAVLPAEQIVVDRRPHPWVGYDGYSPLEAAQTQIDVLRQIDIMRTSAAQNGAEPSLVIIAPPGTKPEEVDKLQAKLDSRHAGPWNHRKIMVIAGGSGVGANAMQIIPWSRGPGELGGEAGWEQLVGFVSSLVGVPKVITGLTDAGSYAEFYAALKQFYTRTLLPLAKRIAWRWTQQLVWPVWGKRYRVQLDLPAIDDRDSMRADLDLLGKYKAVTVNELRGSLGKKPLPPEQGDKLVGEADAEKERMLLQAKLQGGGTAGPGGGAPPQPDNPDAEGSLPGRAGFTKAGMDGAVLRAGGREDDDGGGFDETAESTAAAYPHHFREETAATGGSHMDQLREMLSDGNPEPMSHGDAYREAFDQLETDRHSGIHELESEYPADWDEPFKADRFRGNGHAATLVGSVRRAKDAGGREHKGTGPGGGQFVGNGGSDAKKTKTTPGRPAEAEAAAKKAAKKQARHERNKAKAERLAAELGERLEKAPDGVKRLRLADAAAPLAAAAVAIQGAKTRKDVVLAVKEFGRQYRQATKQSEKVVAAEGETWAGSLDLPRPARREAASAIRTDVRENGPGSLFPDDPLDSVRAESSGRSGIVSRILAEVSELLSPDRLGKALEGLDPDFAVAAWEAVSPQGRESVSAYRKRLETLGVAGLPAPTAEDRTAEDYYLAAGESNADPLGPAAGRLESQLRDGWLGHLAELIGGKNRA